MSTPDSGATAAQPGKDGSGQSPQGPVGDGDQDLSGNAPDTAGLEAKADRVQGGDDEKEEDLEDKAYGGDDDTPNVPLPG